MMLADSRAQFGGLVYDDVAAEARDERYQPEPLVDVQHDASCTARLVVDLGVGLEAQAQHLLASRGERPYRYAVRPATVVLKRFRPPLAQVELVLGMCEGEIRTNQPIDVVEPVALNLAPRR